MKTSKHLIELMGGQIRVSSTPGAGSVFSFWIPVSPASTESAVNLAGESAPPVAQGADPARLRPARVLVVEDNPVKQAIAQAMIEQLGPAVAMAGDGQAGVDAYARLHPQRILMDCQMAGLDGYTAAREIRRLESASGARVPIIALTASAMASDRQQCIDAGMDDFLSKPFTRIQLRAVLERWLAQRPAPQARTAASARAPGAESGQSAQRPERLRPGAIEQLAESIDRENAVTALRRLLAQLSVAAPGFDAALAAQDLEEIKRRAHGLKPTSLYFGAAATSRQRDA